MVQFSTLTQKTIAYNMWAPSMSSNVFLQLTKGNEHIHRVSESILVIVCLHIITIIVKNFQSC